MSASKYVKEQGLPSLRYVADKVGKPVQTINNWYHNNFALFEVVVAGCVYNEALKVKEDIDAARVMVVPSAQYEIMKQIINEREREDD